MDESYNYLNEEPAIIIDQNQAEPAPNSQQQQLQAQQEQPGQAENGEAVEGEDELMGDGIFSNVTQGLQGNYRNMLMAYWQETIDSIEHDEHDFKNHQLPLARIKKVMKTDEEVRMISAEAPILFAKGCDVFITELTMRAWIHAEENKRRTLQKSDIAAALQKSDMFDFLIDIVPREDDKQHTKRGSTSRQNSLNFGGSIPVSSSNALGGVLDQHNASVSGASEANAVGHEASQKEDGVYGANGTDREFDGVNNVANDYQYNDLTYENRY